MAKKASNVREIPSIEQLEQELEREKYKRSYRRVFRSTVYSLIVMAAVAVLIAMLYLPVLRIYGQSMLPTLAGGDIVVAVKDRKFETGDIVAFYYNNKILVKRVIATSGESVDMDEDGNVYVNEKPIHEPYVAEKALGNIDIELPYKVQEELFLMGDYRSVSMDSRNSEIGCVSEDEIVGRLIFRVWPLQHIGELD